MAQGWSTPPTEPAPAESAGPRPLWKHGWFIGIVCFLAGVTLGAFGDDDPGPKVVTVTSIVERTVEVPATTEELATTEDPPTTEEPKPATTAAPRGPATNFADGEYRVGEDIRPGTYRSDGSSCYWARLKDFDGDLDSIIANDNTSGPAIVRIAPSDYGFETSGGCTWTRT